MANNTQNLYGIGANFTAANKWFAYLPLESVLGKKYNNLDLHLVNFSLPQLEMGSMETSYKGYKKQMPTKVLNAEQKELTLTYLIDDKWNNYKALYAWISSVNGTLNPIIKEDTSGKVQPSEYIPLRIYLIDNYKHKIIQFLFENCWIKMFNEINLEANNTEPLQHQFTFCYDRYLIEEI